MTNKEKYEYLQHLKGVIFKLDDIDEDDRKELIAILDIYSKICDNYTIHQLNLMINTLRYRGEKLTNKIDIKKEFRNFRLKNL